MKRTPLKYGWQLQPPRWTSLATLCGHRQWSRTYLEHAYRNTVPTGPGVYMICSSAQNGISLSYPSTPLYEKLYNTIYVGQAENLRRRFGQHLRGYRNISVAQLIFRRLDYWYTETLASELDQVEQCFLDVFGPSVNDRNVSARIGNPITAGSVGRHKPRS